ncbi:MAG: ATP-binding protein, partial [Bacillota bacterium]|nr:ATP-binding protein [Bacillota bacterium]
MCENVGNKYDESQIQVLEGLEAVRKRPGMYIGSTSINGLHHLVYEIVDNSIDEAMAGFCKNIYVTIRKGNIIYVKDDGRGIPVGIHHKTGIPAIEMVFTMLHAGGKFGGGGYKVSGGLHGVGASVVNALSRYLEVIVHSETGVYFQRYERGKVAKALTKTGENDGTTGTEVSFFADDEIFETLEYDYEVLLSRLREQAFLNKGIRIVFRDERVADDIKEKVLCYEGGIVSFVEYLNKNKEKINPEVIFIQSKTEHMSLEIAMQYNDSYNENIISFANDIKTTEGGAHETGFKAALTKVLNDYARKYNVIKEADKNLSGEDVREGLAAVVSIKLEEAQFEGQTKTKLGNSEARSFTETSVNGKLESFLEENPSVARLILDKALMANRAREAAK